MDASLFSSPEFQVLLGHNEAPSSDLQVEQIAAACQLSLTRLAAVDSELSVLENRVGELREERTELLQWVANCKTILHPLRRTPPELWSEIFLFASASTWQLDGAVYTNIMPWKLAQVCHNWREICLACSTLWSELMLRDIDFDNSNGSGFNTSLLLAQHLQHSKQQPLDIHIVCRSPIPKRAPVLQTLLPTSPRWRLLDLNTTFNSFPSLSPIRAALPSLVTVNVRISDRNANYPIPRLINNSPVLDLFEFAPQLSELYGDRTVLSTARFPRKNVKYYDELCWGARDDGWYTDFAKMQELVFCGLTVGPEDAIIQPGTPTYLNRIRFPNLRHLRLKIAINMKEVDMQVHLSRFDLKNLTLLDVSYPVNFGTTIFSEFSSIRHLRLLPLGNDALVVPGKKLFGLLRGLPALKTIFLGNLFRLDDELMEAILDPEFAPTLTEIYWQRDLSSDEQALMARHVNSETKEIRALHFAQNAEEYSEFYGYEYMDTKEGDV